MPLCIRAHLEKIKADLIGVDSSEPVSGMRQRRPVFSQAAVIFEIADCKPGADAIKKVLADFFYSGWFRV